MDTVIRLISGRRGEIYSLVFGKPNIINQLEGRGTAEAFFSPGQVFALKIYDRHRFGTTRWVLYVLKAPTKNEECTLIPNIMPGAIVLLRAKGKKLVSDTLAWISDLESEGDPTSLSPETFLKQHLIINTNFLPRTPRKPKF